MADNETGTIAVPATPTMDKIAMVVRAVVLVIGAVTTIAGFVSKHDLAGFIAYVQSSAFLTVAGLVSTGIAFGWGYWKTGHRGRQLANLAVNPDVTQVVAK